ncbi:hypothetical protein Pfo_005488 [Paulownia fortunei]|nr:hypothetical protein Pfo_005488 [Paulownia fortunei]
MLEITFEDNNEGDKVLKIEDIFKNSRKRKHTSKAWNHFKRLMVENTLYAECNYCKARLKAQLRTCRKRPRKMNIHQSLIIVNKKTSGSQELTTHIFNQEDSRHKLASMVILHIYSLSIVEHVGFRKFVVSLQPCFNMISRNTLRSDILKIYNVQRAKCYKLLDKLNYRIAITTDMWTSNNTKKGFMAITGYYIDDSWILQHCILRFIYVPSPHTAEVQSDLLVESFMDWNINYKVSTIMVDNCTTNDAMLHLLLDKLSKRDMLLNGKVLHMCCCARILNLIMKDGLQLISGAIDRIRILHINCSNKLSLNCKTRWNSTYLMLETAIIYKDVFPRVKCRDKYYKTLPTDEDWVNAIEICGKLKFFYHVTEIFFSTLYPTSNFYFSKICDIKLKLDEWVKSLNMMIHCMAEKMLENYEKYWDASHIMMGVAAVLDPSYKLKLVEFYFPLIYGEKSQFKVDEIRQNCYDLLVDYQSRAATLNENSLSFSNLGIVQSASSFGVSSLLDASNSDTLEMYDKFVSSSSNPTTSMSLTSELDMYLEESVLPRTQNFDILSWWKTNGVKYPNLQKMARDILVIPVSTVASECAFSISGRMVSSHHSRLHPTTLKALMCARRWLWNEVKEFDPLLISQRPLACPFNVE